MFHTPGGIGLAATQNRARALQAQGKVSVFVPHYAMSAGTLIALAAEEIVICEHAVLGPVTRNWASIPPLRSSKLPDRNRSLRLTTRH